MSAAKWHIQCERTGNVSVTNPGGPSLVIPISAPSPCSTTVGSGPRWALQMVPFSFPSTLPCYSPVARLQQRRLKLLLTLCGFWFHQGTLAEPFPRPEASTDGFTTLASVRLCTPSVPCQGTNWNTNKTEDWELSGSCASDAVRATYTDGLKDPEKLCFSFQ